VSSIVLRHGLVVGESANEVVDLIIDEGVIRDVGPNVSAPSGAVEIDVEGCWVGPGFVD
jgi:dihydroorotase-like cyclic amidohydrolase